MCARYNNPFYISVFLIIRIYLLSTRICHICWYSICHICRYTICNIFNFNAQNDWSISNSFWILLILTNTCARIPIESFAIEFAFTIAWSIFYQCFSFICSCYNIKYFNIIITLTLENCSCDYQYEMMNYYQHQKL